MIESVRELCDRMCGLDVYGGLDMWMEVLGVRNKNDMLKCLQKIFNADCVKIRKDSICSYFLFIFDCHDRASLTYTYDNYDDLIKEVKKVYAISKAVNYCRYNKEGSIEEASIGLHRYMKNYLEDDFFVGFGEGFLYLYTQDKSEEIPVKYMGYKVIVRDGLSPVACEGE